MTDSVNTTSIDSLLDGTLDDLADVPEFKPFSAGAHKVIIKWHMKEISSKPVIMLNLTAVETVELKDATDAPIVAGDTTEVMFQLYTKDGRPNEIAQGQWKELLRPLAAHFGTKSNRETMDASNGAECLVVTGIRVNKKDLNDVKYYTSVDTIAII